MIIKSHIRGGYRSAAEYLKEQGKNETTRLVEISDRKAKNLDEAFHNMWVVASNTMATKPLHHISINPIKDERLTDKQVLAIVERCEQKYGYQMHQHQRVIVEHVRDGRQHFHVIWNRVNLMSNRTMWPGEHWKKSKQVCREMEHELGLKWPVPKRIRGAIAISKGGRPSPKLMSAQSSKNKLHLAKLMIRPHFHTKTQTQRPLHALINPTRPSKGWPEAAIFDWEIWGHRNPPQFFAKWPELTKA